MQNINTLYARIRICDVLCFIKMVGYNLRKGQFPYIESSNFNVKKSVHPSKKKKKPKKKPQKTRSHLANAIFYCVVPTKKAIFEGKQTHVRI